MEEIVKEYKNEDITVVWYPAKCTQSQCCFKAYSEVFDPKKRPWVQLSNGETEKIIRTVEACPSGALSYYFNKKEEKAPAETKPVLVRLSPAGSVKIEGTFIFRDETGKETLIENDTVAICRCGISNRKPFCDGMHKTLDAWKALGKNTEKK